MAALITEIMIPIKALIARVTNILKIRLPQKVW